MNALVGTLHRIARVILGIGMIIAMTFISRLVLIFLLFGATFGGVHFLIILAGAALSAIAAPFLIFSSRLTARSIWETGLAAVNIASVFLFISSLPQNMDSPAGVTSMLVSMLLYLGSALALLILLTYKAAFSSGLSRLTLAAVAMVSGLLFLFSALPLIFVVLKSFGVYVPALSNSQGSILIQGEAFGMIILASLVVGLLIVMALRRLRKPTSVNS